MITRRALLKGGLATGAAFVGLRSLVLTSGWAEPYASEVNPYGALARDPQGILDLPSGFSYRVISRAGDPMSDGLKVPGDPDGMAAFPGEDGRVVLVRNHELDLGELFKSPFGEKGELLNKVDHSKLYDLGTAGTPHIGGTTTLVYNPASGAVERQFLSLSGTLRNCCGGPTPWGSWLSCEETEDRKGVPGTGVDHGFVFEVPANAESGLIEARPLRAMGRFYHEAAAVDPRTGIVYLTEDRQDGLFYRFLPEAKGELARGGKLQALALRSATSADMRNWNEHGFSVRPGEQHGVHWIDLQDVEARAGHLREEGFAKGAGLFARSEGIVMGDGELYFASTTGGPARAGQIWRYRPSRFEGMRVETVRPGHLELYIEPNDSKLLDMCDNLTLAPWGDLVICEDGAGDNFIRGVTSDGKLYTLARAAAGRAPHADNDEQKSEFAGACFSPDGKTLFVNLQEAGLTVAVTGPWGARAA